MDKIDLSEFKNWAHSNNLQLEPNIFEFRQDAVFRIPIGDYLLQLDYRIEKALNLFQFDSRIYVCNRRLNWNLQHFAGGDKECKYVSLLKTLGFSAGVHVLRFGEAERRLVEGVLYLINRANNSALSVWAVCENNPRIIFSFSSPESVWAYCRDRLTHDEACETLMAQNIPVYGPHVRNPIPEPVYSEIVDGKLRVTVDPKTGRPIGPGSAESVIRPEFLPPDKPDG
jgi:hypothetical protein